MSVDKVRNCVLDVDVIWFVTNVFGWDLLTLEVRNLFGDFVLVDGVTGSQTRLMSKDSLLQWWDRLVKRLSIVNEYLWVNIDKFLNILEISLIVTDNMLAIFVYDPNIIVEDITQPFTLLEILEFRYENRRRRNRQIHAFLVWFYSKRTHKWQLSLFSMLFLESVAGCLVSGVIRRTFQWIIRTSILCLVYSISARLLQVIFFGSGVILTVSNFINPRYCLLEYRLAICWRGVR